MAQLATISRGIRGRVLMAAMLLGSLGGCGGSGGSVPPEEGQGLAVRFLDELRAGRVEAAWRDLTTTEFKSILGQDGLRTFVRTHPALRGPAEFAELADVERNGLPMSECTFQSTAPKPPKEKSIRVLLAREEGNWKVEKLIVE